MDRTNPVDIAVITSSEIEFEIISNKLKKNSPTSISVISDGIETIFPIKLPKGGQAHYRLMALRIDTAIGNAAIVTRKLILERLPQCIVLLGPAGGIENRGIKLGDMLIPDQIVDYGSHKSGLTSSFQWPVYRTDPILIQAVQRLKANSERKSKGRDGSVPKVHIGPIASGDKIDTSSFELDDFFQSWPNLIGVELDQMQATGIGTVIEESRSGYKPGLLVVRVVADLLDGRKISRQLSRISINKAVDFLFDLFRQTPIPPIDLPNDLKSVDDPTNVQLFRDPTEEPISQSTNKRETKTNGAKRPEAQSHLPFEIPEARDEPFPFQIPSYDSDQNGEEDYLDIEQDVEAFASLICARSTLPPLSIGLFGEWGSGKSFFMRKLRERVGDISQDARESGRLQKEIAYYKRVVQIEFNAWHYAEGNLWASLVEHILENLHIKGVKPDIIENLKNKLVSELTGQKTDEEQARKDVANAQTEIKHLEDELHEKRAEYNKVSEKLDTLESKDVFKAVFESLDIQTQVSNVNQDFRDLGIPNLINNGKDFFNALDQLKETIKRTDSVLMPFVNSPQRKKWIVLFVIFMVVVPFAGLGIGWAVLQISNQQVSQYFAWIATIGGWIGVVADTIRRATKWVSDRIGPIEQLKQRIIDQVAVQQDRINEQIAQLEKRRLVLEQDKETALRKLDEVKRNKEIIEEKLRQATPSRLLAQFIADRVESNDYRKHLGVLALVRDDFERLSYFIEHENRECESFETLEQEQADADRRINRIVLYIDDLDRCSTEKVIQVLQAVHLLLAFPLFVVVVAVDARWISGALYEEYGTLLKPKNTLNNNLEKENELIGATALDYLEKIFQIPFWLSPMNLAARKAMVDGLVKLNLVETSNEDASTLGDMDSNTLGELDKLALDNENGGVVQTPDDAEQPQAPTLEQTNPDLNPAALTITPAEQLFINQLSPILGRSPRALKRFVNVYRLLKSSVPEVIQRQFLSQRNAEFRVAMFLLAIVTHAPEFSQEFFGSLYKFRQDKPNVNRLTLAHWKKLLGGSENTSLTTEQKQLVNWIKMKDAKPIRDTNLSTLIWWARRTCRFSFLLEPEVAEWLTIE